MSENTTQAVKPQNIVTHTGAVHAPGRYYKQLRTTAPACAAGLQALSRYHYLAPTDAEVTCKRCIARAASGK